MPTLIEMFDARFLSLYKRSVTAAAALPEDLLFKKCGAFSYGELLLRSAAAVEQTFGGITARLWDDPFEWTLPEELSTAAKIAAYLDEVESTRLRGFAFFGSDDDLVKTIPAPEELRPIFDILLETLARAEHFQGRAFAISEFLDPAAAGSFHI